MSQALNADETSDKSSQSQGDTKGAAPTPYSAKEAVAEVLKKYQDDDKSSDKVEKQEEATASTEDQANAEGSVSKVNETTKEAQSESGKEETTDQTEQDTDKTDDEKLEEVVAEDETKKPVPYERFYEVNEKAKAYEEPARRMAQVETFCSSNNISPDQFHEALRIQALINSGNLQEAKKRLAPILEQLDLADGARLPQDLQKMVDDGKIELEVAQSWAKDRFAAQANKQRVEKTTEQVEQERQQATQRSINTAAVTWAKSKSASDPSFKPKANPSDPDGLFEMTIAKFEHYWNTVPMHSVEEVIAHYDKSYNEVLAFGKRLLPKPAKQRVLSSTASSTTANGKEKPTDTSKPGWAKDVAKKVLARY